MSVTLTDVDVALLRAVLSAADGVADECDDCCAQFPDATELERAIERFRLRGSDAAVKALI